MTEYDITRATMKIKLALWKLDKGYCKQVKQRLNDAKFRCAVATNVVIRAYWAEEGARLNEFVLEHHTLPRSQEWPPAKFKSDGYYLVKQAAPELITTVASSIARMATQKWRSERWEALIRQSCSPPHFKKTDPIPLNNQGYRFVVREASKAEDDAKDRTLFYVCFSLKTGRGNSMQIPLHVRDGFQRTLMRELVANKRYKTKDEREQALCEGKTVPGQAIIQEDSKRPGQWYIRFAYKRRVRIKQGGQSAAINRGIRFMFAAVCESGPRWIVDGKDVVKHLKQTQARRNEYKYQSHYSGRSGRGKRVILRPTERLSRKSEFWRQTWCQRVARRFVEWLKKKGVTKLYIEDFTGIRRGLPEKTSSHWVYKAVQEWPYYQIQTRIVACCDEEGITVVQVPAYDVSRRCPRCGHVSDENKDLVRWKIACEQCGFREHLDVAAARNILARGEANANSEATKFAFLGVRASKKKHTARKTVAKDTKKGGNTRVRRKS